MAYISVMQSIRATLFSRYTHDPLGECIHQENISSNEIFHDIPRESVSYLFYTMPMENTVAKRMMGRLVVIPPKRLYCINYSDWLYFT